TCSLDGGKPSSCVPATSTTHSYTKLADGAHNFVLKAQIQPSGGTRYKASSAPYSWTVDTTPPAVPTITQLATTSSTTPQIDFSSDLTAKYFNCKVEQLDAFGNVAAVIQTGTTTSTTTGTTTTTTTGCSSGWPVTLPTGVNAKYRASVWALDLYLNPS